MYPPPRPALTLLALTFAAVCIGIGVIAAQPPLDLSPADWLATVLSR